MILELNLILQLNSNLIEAVQFIQNGCHLSNTNALSLLLLFVGLSRTGDKNRKAMKKYQFFLLILCAFHFWPVFSKICLRRRKLDQIRVFIMVWECSENHFFFENPPLFEKFLDPRLAESLKKGVRSAPSPSQSTPVSLWFSLIALFLKFKLTSLHQFHSLS